MKKINNGYFCIENHTSMRHHDYKTRFSAVFHPFVSGLLFFVSAFFFGGAGLSVHAQLIEFGNPYAYSQRQAQPQEPFEAAKYKGGMKGLNQFLAKEFRPVQSARGVDGTIFIVCEITAKGRIGNYQVRQSMGRELDAEAVRVLKKLKFRPARQGKKKVPSQINITFPIRHGRVSFSTLQTVDV